MELDKRIASITDIYSVNDGCHDWKFMNQKGYFANSIFDFKDLKRLCVYGEYDDYREHDKCFSCRVYSNGITECEWFTYFIPEDDLKPKEPEKKYRPFSLNEFLEQYEIGETVTFRLKKDGYAPEAECLVEYTRMITGYEILPEDKDTSGKGSILLGGCPPIGLARLFELYERENTEPFGVIDEEGAGE